jgi:hypothetical protein
VKIRKLSTMVRELRAGTNVPPLPNVLQAAVRALSPVGK